MDMQRIVFIHLPGQTTAVPAGRLEMDVNAAGGFLHAHFAYGTHYLQRGNALDVDPVALPRQGTPLKPSASCILASGRWAAPRGWTMPARAPASSS